MRRSIGLRFLLSALLLVAPVAHSAVVVEVAGNTATAQISLPGNVSADVTLTFDQPTNLAPQNLGITARLLNPLFDLPLLQQLAGLLSSLTSSLPVLITIEPPAGSGFAMDNTVHVEVHTHLLPYTEGSRLRLFKASLLGGQFRDITEEVLPGSVRTRGTTGGFSQFLVLADLRDTDVVIAQKLAYLRGKTALLTGTERVPLDDLLDTVEDAVYDARYADAIAGIDALRARVSERSGTYIPNQWTPTNRNNNLAGELLGGAATLKFSVGFKRDYGD
jgi:hypothetical protein